jgi:predicted RNA-binding protein with EMAP domain
MELLGEKILTIKVQALQLRNIINDLDNKIQRLDNEATFHKNIVEFRTYINYFVNLRDSLERQLQE